MLAPLPHNVLTALGDEGWCARDVVAHLALRQRAAIIERVSAILLRQGAAIPNVPASLMDVEPQRARPFVELLLEFESGRKEAVGVLRSIAPEQWQLRGVQARLGELSIA